LTAGTIWGTGILPSILIGLNSRRDKNVSVEAAYLSKVQFLSQLLW